MQNNKADGIMDSVPFSSSNVSNMPLNVLSLFFTEFFENDKLMNLQLLF